MSRFLFIVISSLMVSSCAELPKSFAKDDISIVPRPRKIILGEESFMFSKKTSIFIENDNQKPAAKYLSDLFEKATGYKLAISESKEKADIIFSTDDALKVEAYILNVSPKQIKIRASDAAGFFYSVQTLRQLLPPTIEVANKLKQNWSVPSITINDEPRFSWRGMHLDFSRHFFGVDEVKTFLDYMALFKLNTFHMHLTDDQGWRIEIKKYPLLTEKGAWRNLNSHDKECIELAKTESTYFINEKHFQERDGEKKYGGFFTQEQIKDIIKYATERQIEVIPEIDMPGHFKSAIDNYPFLSCTNEAEWGNHFSSPACLGKETSYEFVKNILAEVSELFPSKYIHIGGDEVNIESWKTCPLCQKVIKDKQLKNEYELQSYFNKEIETFLKTKGKKIIGWDEIVEGGITNDATIMWWRNWAPKMRNIAANNGNRIVICPDFEYYFDFKNEATPLDKVYNYDPVPEGFNESQTNYILGVQANLWSEYIPNFKRLQYQTFPRMLALAESGWASKENKNFDDFQKRMNLQYKRLDALNIQYYIPSVLGLKNKVAFLDKAIVELKAPLNDMNIYYTLDGSVPSNKSIKYDKPIEFTETSTINTIAYRGNIPSEVKSSLIEKQTYIEAVNVNPVVGTFNRWVGSNLFSVVDDVKLPTNASFEVVKEISLDGYENGDNISMVFKGYFMADEDGLYEFATKSDDGSLLFINDKLVVDNGGNHSAIMRNGMVALKKGWHPLIVKFHEASGGNELTVWYKSPKGESQILNGVVIAR